VPSIYIGEMAVDETGKLWIGQPGGTWDHVRPAIDTTPHAAGTLGATYALPIDQHASIEASVAEDVAMTVPSGAPGDWSRVELTSTASEPVTVTLPTLVWVSPLGSIWNGLLAPGESILISFWRSSTLGWVAVDGRLSTTAIPVDLVPTTGVYSTVDLYGYSDATSEPLSALLSRIAAGVESLESDLREADPLGNMTGTVQLATNQYRHFTGTLTGNVVLEFAIPNNPTTITLRLKQDATGGRSITLPAGVATIDGAAITWPATTANAEVLILLRYDGAGFPWIVQVFAPGVPA
jgi:hypothetical protein